MRSEFKCCFYFDLADFRLKSTSGAPIKPELITQDVKRLSVVPNSPEWLGSFYCFWKNMVYKSSLKTKASYMFALSSCQTFDLRCAEKLYRAGYIVNANIMITVVQSVLRSVDAESKSPWELLGIPKCLFDALVQSESLRNDFRYSGDFQEMRKIDFWGDVWSVLEDLDIIEDFVLLMKRDRTSRDHIEDLIQNKAYNRKRLFEYIFKDLPEKQGFDETQEAIRVLRDYAAMSSAVFGSIENKYPKYLKTEHDIMVSKLNAMKQALETADIVEAYNRIPINLQYKSSYFYDLYEDTAKGMYQIITPKNAEDIIEEGKAMHHCVASYISRIKDPTSDCLIVFARSYDSSSYSWRPKYKRHLTIELKGDLIVQARGAYNRDPSEKELRFLKEYCDAKGLKFNSSLENLYERIVGFNPTETKCTEGLLEAERVA